MRLIDSPGFIDTEGKQKDEEYINEFKLFFKREISYLNCICFVLNFSCYRNNETQIELYNKISSLFSEEIKNNFVFIFTHYTSTGNTDAKESLNKNNVFKNMINANNIFRVDSELAFTTDKELRKLLWQRTSEEIQKLINNIFLKFNPVTTNQSAEVIQKRKDYQQLFNEKLEEFKDIIEEIKDLLKKEENIKKNLPEKEKTFKKKVTLKNDTENKNTNCQRCNKTCHEICDCHPLMGIRYFCKIFNFFGMCRRCNCHFSRHLREKYIYSEMNEIAYFNDDNEREKFLNQEVQNIEKKFEMNIQDLNEIDKEILRNNDIDINVFYKNYYDIKSLEEGDSSLQKIIKYKMVIAIQIVKNIHSSVNELNKLALNKNIEKSVDIFFDELKYLKDFENKRDIIEKIKTEYLKLTEGKEKNNNKFMILTDEDAKSDYDKLSSSMNFKMNSSFILNLK